MPRVILALGAGAALGWSSFALSQSVHVMKILVAGCPHSATAQTGFRVQGLPGIFTALHGVSGCTTILAVPSTSGAEPGVEFLAFEDLRVVSVDLGRDVAQLMTDDLELADEGLISLDATAAIEGPDLKVIGFPFGAAAQRSFAARLGEPSELLLREMLEPDDIPAVEARGSPSLDAVVLPVDGYMLPGMSGSPVLDAQDRVVGIGIGGLRQGAVGIGWAAPWVHLEWRAAIEVADEVDALADSTTHQYRSKYLGQDPLPIGIVGRPLRARATVGEVVIERMREIPIDLAVFARSGPVLESFEPDPGFHFAHVELILDRSTNVRLPEAVRSSGGDVVELRFRPLFADVGSRVTGRLLAVQHAIIPESEVVSLEVPSVDVVGDYLVTLQIPEGRVVSHIALVDELGETVAEGRLGADFATPDGSVHFRVALLEVGDWAVLTVAGPEGFGD